MRTTLFAAAIVLFASPALAVQPTPISFETIVTLDKFRITNTSPSAFLHELFIRPSADLAISFSHPQDMLWASSPPWPGDDRTGWQISRLSPGRWAEFTGTWEAGSMLATKFAESPFQLGFIFAPVANGTFEGWTVPEPGTWVMGILAGVAMLVAWRLRQSSSMCTTS